MAVWSAWPRNIHVTHLFHRDDKILLPEHEVKRLVIVIFFQIHEGMVCGFEKAQLQRNCIVQSQSLHFGGGGRLGHLLEQCKPFLKK